MEETSNKKDHSVYPKCYLIKYLYEDIVEYYPSTVRDGLPCVSKD